MTAIICACAPSLQQTKVTNETRPDVATSVAHSGLTADEKRWFAEANTRAEMGDYDVTDKTVSTIIGDQRTYDADKLAQEQAQRKLAEEGRARRQARTRELDSVLTIALVDKGFQDADAMNGEYNSYVTFVLVLKNRTNRPIRSFEGKIHFENTLGNDVDVISLTYEHLMGPNARVDWNGTVRFNQFDRGDVALREARIENLHLRWEPKAILFADGTRLEQLQSTESS